MKLTFYLQTLVIFLAGCSSTSHQSSKAIKKSPTLESIYTSTPLPTMTVQPEPVLRFTSTPRLIDTQLPTPLSPTFLPTLPLVDREEAKIKVLEFLENNEGFKLPCWWGLVPGKTTLEEARNRIEPYSSQIQFSGDFRAIGGIDYFHLVPPQYSTTRLINTRLYFDHQILKELEILELDWPGHYIRRFLHDYGSPSKVLFQTITNFPGDHPPFMLFLFYPDQGILAYFFSNDEDVWVQGEKLHGCFRSGSGLFLWSPSDRKEIGDAGLSSFLQLENKENFWLEDISPYTPESFYQTFQSTSGEDLCIDFTIKN